MSKYHPGPDPPGQERPYPAPTKTGRIPFEYGPTGLKGETYYLLWGSLSTGKTPLICMHGGPGMGHNYLLPTALLATDFDIPVILYDQVGCGESTHFPEKKGDHDFWTPQLFMAEQENLRKALGIETFDLLGQSWGGMLAGQYAIEMQPKGLRKLIIADSPTDMEVWVRVANGLRQQLPKEVANTLQQCEDEGRTDSEEYTQAVDYFYRRHFCRVHPYPPEAQQILDNVAKDPTVYETMNGPSEFHVVGSLKTWSITDQLHLITEKTAPGGMLVMNGHFDEAQDETTEAFFTKPSCKVKWIRYALSSHTPMLEETEKYLKDLGTFLSQ
ncbi:l-amino acid amidase [Acrodontium crateriforme]|uniref:L-amino acid amidase n=1 Tax=Acrodontium crateriforme TaxID=150365 RepID=A0AAQ3M6Z6_9PEZI|nr:l-amino acid amidase [Acrodontium crateriforme]